MSPILLYVWLAIDIQHSAHSVSVLILDLRVATVERQITRIIEIPVLQSQATLYPVQTPGRKTEHHNNKAMLIFRGT